MGCSIKPIHKKDKVDNNITTENNYNINEQKHFLLKVNIKK